MISIWVLSCGLSRWFSEPASKTLNSMGCHQWKPNWSAPECGAEARGNATFVPVTGPHSLWRLICQESPATSRGDEMGISDTFFTAQTIVEAIPEHLAHNKSSEIDRFLLTNRRMNVGGKVTLSCPWQKDTCGRQACRPAGFSQVTIWAIWIHQRSESGTRPETRIIFGWLSK